jgi:hypothetical protein
MNRKTIPRLAAIIGFAALAFAGMAMAAATPITLDGLAVDSSYLSFTDPGTGVLFSNAVSAGNAFIVDYWTQQSPYINLPDLDPGLVVSSNGYVGNGDVFLPFDFGFTMTFPAPVSQTDMIMAYSTNYQAPGSISLDGYDANNQLVASVTAGSLTGYFTEEPLSLATGVNDIKSVVLTPTNLFDAFGDISFTSVPEPASLSLLGLGSLALLARGRRSEQ